MAEQTPPDYFKSGSGYEKLNAWLRFFMGNVYRPADPSIITVPGTDTSLGTMRATAHGGGTVLNDFSLYDASNSEGIKIGITNGLLSGQLPAGMIEGGDPPYALDVSGSGYVWLVVTVDSDPDSDNYGEVTSVSLDSGASTPEDTDDTGYCTLGDFAVTNQKLSIGSGRQGIGSQTCGYCGGTFYFDRA